MDIKSMQKRISSIEGLRGEVKTAQEAIKNALENDSTYQESVREAKEINTKKKRLKDDILNQAENRESVEKIKDLKDEIGTLEELLSYELMEYSQANNTDIIQGNDGMVRKFKIVVRLLPGRGFDSEQNERQ